MMDDVLWQRVGEVLERALSIPPERRSAWLDETCESPEVRAEVRGLLAASHDATEFFDGFASRVIDPLTIELLDPAAPRHGPGDRVLDYEIVGLIGRGGMGDVYKAWDVRLNRHAALKFLPLRTQPSTDAAGRLLREARAASALDHPNICTIYGVHETPGGEAFIAMAYYEGTTLATRLRQGTLAVAECLEIARQVALGLAVAHDAGIIHRDLKPANLVLCEGGLVKILDFGVAHRLGPDGNPDDTPIVGTPMYMAPEQLRGEPPTAKVDLWALGMILYEMLAGRPPSLARDAPPGAPPAGATRPVVSLDRVRADVPPRLSRLIDRLLTIDPEGRLANAGQLLDDIRGLTQADVPVRRSLWRRGLVGSLIVAIALGIGGAAAWVWHGTRVASTAASPLSRYQLAILPFSVRGQDEFQYLREGIVDLLTAKLDGAGDLRCVDPQLLLAYLAGDRDRAIDPARGLQAARALGAGHYVLGSVTAIGGRLQVSAALYDGRGVALTRAHALAAGQADLPKALDDLAQQLVAGQLTDGNERLSRLAARTTESFEALRAYLDGERALREGRFASARDSLGRAVAVDPAFAIAWYRLARATGWTGPPDLNARATEEALRLGETLPRRSRGLVQAYRALRLGTPAEAERIAREVLAGHPDDREASLLLAEALFHNNPASGRPAAEARERLEAALMYEPDRREVLVHLMDIAARERRASDVTELTGRFLRASPSDDEQLDLRHAYGALGRLLRNAAGDRQSALDDLSAAGPGALAATLTRIAPQIGDLDLGYQLAMKLSSFRQPPWRGMAALARARYAAAMGQWVMAREAFAEARKHTGAMALVCWALAAASEPAPADEARMAREAVAAWNASRDPLPDGLHQGDEGAVKTFLIGMLDARLGAMRTARQQLARLHAESARRSQATIAAAFARSLGASIAWREGRPADSLSALGQPGPDVPFHLRERSPLHDRAFDRLLRAEALRALGRNEEAVRWYDSLTDGYEASSTPQTAIILLGRGLSRARLGRSTTAAHDLREALRLLRSAPVPESIIRQAESALEATGVPAAAEGRNAGS